MSDWASGLMSAHTTAQTTSQMTARMTARTAAPATARSARRVAVLMQGLVAGLLGALMLALGPAARASEPEAETDPPGRVGRIVDLQGNVSRYDHEEDRWSDAERNRPLTTGDRLSTAGGARVEVRIGSTVLRLGDGTEVEFVRLDDERLAFELHSGALALRVRTGEQAAEIEVVTREARLLPLRAGHYRIDRQGDVTYAAAWRGDLRVDGPRRLTAITGQRLELYRDERSNELRHVWRGLPADGFASWALAEDRRDERSARSDHVSPEMTGAEDLDRWGAWDSHPEYGTIWYPHEVRRDWAPYRDGRWVWVRPWGWTWVDEAPWGFAPFHYGRWVYWRNRWCWAPGGYVRRPVYAPALVAWVGGPSFGVSVNVGGPAIGWVPLAPRERYVPYYRATPVYIDRVNIHPRFGPPGQPGHPQTVPTGPIAYSNQGVPGGVTVVPRDVLSRREPVARAVINVPEVQRAPGTTAPPAPVVVVVPRREPGSRGPVSDDGRPGRGQEVRPVAPAPGQRVETARPDATPPVVAPPRGDSTAPRDRREGRDDREPRAPRETRSGDDVRPVPRVQPVQPAPRAQPVQPVQPVPRVQPAPPPAQGARPAPPVQRAPVQPAPVVVPTRPPAAPVVVPPVPRAPQPQAQRGDDDRKRTTPAPRHGEREREASR